MYFPRSLPQVVEATSPDHFPRVGKHLSQVTSPGRGHSFHRSDPQVGDTASIGQIPRVLPQGGEATSPGHFPRSGKQSIINNKCMLLLPTAQRCDPGYYCVSICSPVSLPWSYSWAPILQMQWLSSPHSLEKHGLSHGTLQCDKKLKSLVIVFKLDSDNPIFYIYIYIYKYLLNVNFRN